MERFILRRSYFGEGERFKKWWQGGFVAQSFRTDNIRAKALSYENRERNFRAKAL